ncbi:MAG: hypothetical protein QGH51_10175 [Planctomycetota bacterium]|jgi:hypothetical protein|nr:hypothetical protein [Planctomycetota bacterium]MDP6942377.1 hypothetical protein [Planctomycetota bacterium]
MNLFVLLLAMTAQAPALDTCSITSIVPMSGVEITGRVFLGDKGSFDPSKKEAVATLRPTDIYKQIPAYQKIVKEDIEKGSARWNMLMKEATRVFKSTIKKVAQGNFVLVVEEGGISGYPVTDITHRVIDAI